VTRHELEHAIRATCDVTDETEVIVFGSQAILGQFPDAPDELRQSAEADIAPKHALDKVDRPGIRASVAVGRNGDTEEIDHAHSAIAAERIAQGAPGPVGRRNDARARLSSTWDSTRRSVETRHRIRLHKIALVV